MPKNNNKYYIEIEKFINITSPEMAYYLGYLWADGYVVMNPPHIFLSICEEDALNIKNSLDKIGKFSYLKKEPWVNGWKSIIIIALYQKNFINLLIENDYDIKSKVQPIKILSKIPDHLKHYWWRGYFDGDGCLYTKKQYRLSLSACLNYEWTFVEDLCDKLGINKFTIKRIKRSGERSHQGESSFVIYSFSNIKKFLNYIYNGYNIDKIGLKRKYELYSNLDYLWNERLRYKIISHQKGMLKNKQFRGVSKYSKNWRVRLTTKDLGHFTNLDAAINCYNYYGKLKYCDLFIPNPIERKMDKEKWKQYLFK